MMKILKGFLSLAVLLVSVSIHADEGMWLIQDINAALEKNMKARGLKLSAKEIYNADAPGTAVPDAVVSMHTEKAPICKVRMQPKIDARMILCLLTPRPMMGFQKMSAPTKHP